MGCSNSNVRKVNHPDIPVEERIIQAGERLLYFNKVKIETTLDLIETISFPIETSHLESLYDLFKVKPESPTGVFLRNTVNKKLISTKQLRYLAILLSECPSESKLPLILCSDKNLFISCVSELFHLAIEVIPTHMENIESSVGMYIDQIRHVGDKFIQQLNLMTLDEIKQKIMETEISSREIRIKMFELNKQDMFNDSLDVKLAKVNLKYEEKVQEESQDSMDKAVEGEVIEFNLDLQSANIELSQNLSKDCRNDLSADDKNVAKDESGKVNANDETNLELKSFLDKIPDENIVDFNLSEDSPDLLLSRDSLISPSKLESNANEDVPTLNLKIEPAVNEEIPDVSEKHERVEERKKSVVDMYLERAKNPSKSSETLEKHTGSKIPVKPISKILTNIKSVEALSNPSKVSTHPASRIIGLKESTVHSPRLNAPIELDPSLSESSLLRSKIKKISEPKHQDHPHIPQAENPDHPSHIPKKDSKISSIKDPHSSHDPENPDNHAPLIRKESKIGTIKSKKQ